MPRTPEELARLRAAFTNQADEEEPQEYVDTINMTPEERNAFTKQLREMAPDTIPTTPEPGRTGRSQEGTGQVPGSPSKQYDLSARGKGPGTILILWIPEAGGSVETLASIRF